MALHEELDSLLYLLFQLKLISADQSKYIFFRMNRFSRDQMEQIDSWIKP